MLFQLILIVSSQFLNVCLSRVKQKVFVLLKQLSSCKSINGIFASILSSSLSSIRYLSTCCSKVHAVTTRVRCPMQTFNEVVQEPSFLTSCASYFLSRFVEAISNVCEVIGFRFCQCDTCYGSRFNYHNCTCKKKIFRLILVLRLLICLIFICKLYL